MSEVIVVASGKGGTGKTVTAASIATGLAKRNYNVVIVDSDIGLRNLDIVLGLENMIIYDIVKAADGSCGLKQALVKDRNLPNLSLLPAAQTKDSNAMDPEKMKSVCEALKEEGFDYIIIDSPSGIGQGFRNAIAAADKALIVTTPELTAVRDADRVMGLLSLEGIDDVSVILNHVRSDLAEKEIFLSVEDIKEILPVNIIGIIPEDESVVIAANNGYAAINNENSMAGKAYKNIVRRLLGEDVPFLDISAPVKTSLLQKFIERFRK